MESERRSYCAPTADEIEMIITLHNYRLSDFDIGKELNLPTKTVTHEINEYYYRRNQPRLYYRRGKKIAHLNDKDKDFIRKNITDNPRITNDYLQKALKDALGTDASVSNIRNARKEISTRTYNPQPSTSASQLIQHFPLGGTSAQGVPWQSEQNLYQVPVERSQAETSQEQFHGSSLSKGDILELYDEKLLSGYYEVPQFLQEINQLKSEISESVLKKSEKSKKDKTYNIPQAGTSASQQIQHFPLGGTAQGVPWQSEQNLYQVPVERSQAETSQEQFHGSSLSKGDILELYDEKISSGYYEIPQFLQEINQLTSKISESILKDSEKSKKDNSAKEEQKEGVSSESPQSDKALSKVLRDVDNEESLVDPDNARAGPSGSHEGIVKTIEEYLKKDDQQGASRSDVHEPDNESEKNEESEKQEKSLKRKRQDSE